MRTCHSCNPCERALANKDLYLHRGMLNDEPRRAGQRLNHTRPGSRCLHVLYQYDKQDIVCRMTNE